MAMTSDDAIRIRDMTPADLPAAQGLSREQRWPHRSADWAQLHDLGHGAVAEHDGVIVGTIMWWEYGADYGVVGMVIVANSMQGRGIGRRLMNSAIAALGDRSILLNATSEGRSLYRSLGFEPLGMVFQHQGAAFSVPIAELIPDERIAPMKSGEIDAIIALDRRAIGMDRGHVVHVLCDNAQGIVLNRDGDHSGYALFRRFGRGFSIGPVVGPDLGGAKALISHWLGSNTGIFCRLDVPAKSDLSDWLEELGLPCIGQVMPMCRGTPPTKHDAARIYALANQALG